MGSRRRVALVGLVAIFASGPMLIWAQSQRGESGLWEFQDGTVILAEEVNDNFKTLLAGLVALETQIQPQLEAITVTEDSGVSLAGDLLLPAGRIGVGKDDPSSAIDVDGTVTATSFSGSAVGLSELAGRFTRVYAEVYGPGDGSGANSGVSYCPVGTSLIFYSLTQSHMGADEGWFYCDCHELDNGVFAHIHAGHGHPQNYCQCSALCVAS